MKAGVERRQDLRGHRLLRLQPARIDVHQPSELGQAEHAAVGIIGDMGLAEERRHMVFAMREERDVAHQNHFAIAFDLFEDGVENGGGVLRIARENFLIGLGDARGRVAQAFAGRIVSRPGQQRPHGGFGVFATRAMSAGAACFAPEGFSPGLFGVLAGRARPRLGGGALRGKAE